MTRSKLRKIRRQQSKHAPRAPDAACHSRARCSRAPASYRRNRRKSRPGPRRGRRHRAQDASKTCRTCRSASRPSAPSGSRSSASTSFDDYVKFLPSVSYQSGGPGLRARLHARRGQPATTATTPVRSPASGQYLDEQPITTIQGALDIHMYDIARVEALAGPQGTLYGASSQSGTIRIITNKPDRVGLRRRLQPRGQHGRRWRPGLSRRRLREHSAGRQAPPSAWSAGRATTPATSTTCAATRTFPTSGISMNSLAEDNYNDADTYGARAALRIDLNDNWSITPDDHGPEARRRNGIYAATSRTSATCEVAHWHPENSDDQWVQAALTVEGKIGNFDMTFASSYLKRDVDVELRLLRLRVLLRHAASATASYFYDNDGELINPSQFIHGKDRYTKTSHELRFTSPAENRWRFVGGLFAQRQTHDIQQDYKITGLDRRQRRHRAGTTRSGSPSRSAWTATCARLRRGHVRRHRQAVGHRRRALLQTENSLEGFFGFGVTNPYGSSTGEVSCFDTGQVVRDRALHQPRQDREGRTTPRSASTRRTTPPTT